ncbi:hypothetical protein O181_031786 [Austropuccinia psidii MF-1]|uniref:Uncharacterized protein n=1 Tax=Austropuccinia psidii MF-1 TaxID=1389203 RepID=A0A9Q3H5I8_9BASI|nr:hypothetical protein [Austropuccinia psidii MF-1]
MEATIQSNQMDVEKEEARPNTEVSNLPQETHMWRMPELPPIPQVTAIEIYQCQYKSWFRASKGEQWEICPSLCQGAMNSHLHIKSFLGQEKTIELLRDWSPFSCKEKVKKINNWLKNQNRLSIDQKKELEMTPDLEPEGPVVSTSSKPALEVSKDKPKGPEKKNRGPKNHQGKGKGKVDWRRPYPQGYRIPKLEPSAVDSVPTMARPLMEFTAKEKERINKTFPRKLDSIINTCDRIERKCQSDEVEDLSIFKIHDQLKILKYHILEIAGNTNQFATHLGKSDIERKKLKNEIISNVEQIHKNYEPHMPRHSTPFTEEKTSVKVSLTPLLGENVISERDILKLEEWPTFSGEGEYKHIEFFRTIDM